MCLRTRLYSSTVRTLHPMGAHDPLTIEDWFGASCFESVNLA